jgi:hypothetical protein
MTVHKGENPIENFPLVETREDLPEGQDSSPSVATFNKSFGTSHRGELLSVGREIVVVGDGASKLLLLSNSSKFMDETGEEAPKQAPELLSNAIRESGKQPSSSSKKTSATSERAGRLLSRLLARKVCELFVLLSTSINFSCYF